MIKSLVPTALFAVPLVSSTAAIQPAPIGTGNYRITNRAIRNA
jgi:hypothetical protein